jgi:hypothetical protein
MAGAGVPAHIVRMVPLMEAVRGSGPLGSSIDIPAGTIDRQQNLLILGMASGEVFYVMNTEIRAAPTPQFLQGYFLGQVASEVYRRTAWIIPASKVVMAFSMGMVVGYAGAVAVVANLVVVACRISLFVAGHPAEVQIVRETLPIAYRSLMWFRSNCPVLYSKMRAIIRRGLIEALESAPSGITAEDVAAVLGRILGGAAALPEAGFRALLAVVAKTVLIYSALHLAPAAAHGSAAHARRIGAELVDELRRQGASITPAEQAQILEELARAGAAAGTNIDQLNQALQRLSPALDRLVADFGDHR